MANTNELYLAAREILRLRDRYKPQSKDFLYYDQRAAEILKRIKDLSSAPVPSGVPEGDAHPL
jgi:hypothetical protein